RVHVETPLAVHAVGLLHTGVVFGWSQQPHNVRAAEDQRLAITPALHDLPPFIDAPRIAATSIACGADASLQLVDRRAIDQKDDEQKARLRAEKPGGEDRAGILQFSPAATTAIDRLHAARRTAGCYHDRDAGCGRPLGPFGDLIRRVTETESLEDDGAAASGQ